jgi:hypothetical protein
MAQQQFVTDILQPNDPELGALVSIREVACHWKTDEEFARQRLREYGVRLVKVDWPLMVRWSDVREFETAHTVIFGSKSDSKAKQKEATTT